MNGPSFREFLGLMIVFVHYDCIDGYNLCANQHSSNCNNTKQAMYDSVMFIWNKGALQTSSDSVILEGIFICAIFVTSVFGNGALVSTVIIEERFRTPTNLLVIGQCFVDLGFTCSVILLALVAVFQGGWNMDPYWCIVQTFFNRLFLSLSFSNLALLALDRYVVIVKIKHWNRFSKNQIILFSICVWIIGILTSIPWDLLLFPTSVWYEITDTFCLARYTKPVERKSVILIFLRIIIYIVIPAMIVLVSFYRILGIVRTNRRKVGPSTVSNWRKIAVAVHAKSAYTTLAVLISFTLCMVPFLFVFGMTIIGKPIDYVFAASSKCIYYANTTIKPVIYICRNGLWSRKLRNFFIRKRTVKKVVATTPVMNRSSVYKWSDNEPSSRVEKSVIQSNTSKKGKSKNFHELFSVTSNKQAWGDKDL